MSDSGDRSQAPTLRRRQMARQQGRVARSRELSNAFAQTVSCAGLFAAIPALFEVGKRLCRDSLTSFSLQTDASLFAVADVRRVGWQVCSELAPWLLLAMLSAVVVQIAQGGLLWLPNRVIPNANRVNPVHQWGRVFSLDQVTSTLLSLVKVSVVMWFAGWLLWCELPEVRNFGYLRLNDLVGEGASRLARMLLAVGVALLLFGGLDYLLQWWRFERDLQMTPDEQRDDVKAVENDVSKLRRQRVGYANGQESEQELGPR